MPLGLKNAPAIFQATTEQLIVDIPSMRVYIDDIGWSSDSVGDSLDKFEQLLQRCKDANLKIAPEKTKRCYKELVLLGQDCQDPQVEAVNKREGGSFISRIGWFLYGIYP